MTHLLLLAAQVMYSGHVQEHIGILRQSNMIFAVTYML